MSQGPDNYIWRSYEEWLCNVIAENYPFSSISGRLSFSEGWHFVSAVPSFLLGSFPGGPPAPPCPCFLICLDFLLSPPQPRFSSPFCPHHSFHSPKLQVEGIRMLVPGMLGGWLIQHLRESWSMFLWLASMLQLLPLCSWDSKVMGKVTRNLWQQQMLSQLCHIIMLFNSLLISASVSPSVKVM